jgi:hypothetical protein
MTRLLAVALTLAACASPTPAPAPPAPAPARTSDFQWPVPAGWRSETIPFPLDFAPALPYRGVEELRFAPGFFKPEAPDFWSYAFVWWLEGEPDLSPAVLSRDLKAYFVGLAEAVAKGKFDTQPAEMRADVRAGPATARGAGFTGTARVFDAFKARRLLDLQIEGETFRCGDRQVMLLAASPQPVTAPIWEGLRKTVQGFRCS